MIILDATTKSLEVDLAGAVSTTQLPIVASYVDVTTTTYTPGQNDTQTNNTTAVTVVAAPAASTQRQVKLLTVFNADTASATVTIQYNNNSTLRTIFKCVLGVGSQIIYTDGEGFRVLNSNGNILYVTGSPGNLLSTTTHGDVVEQTVSRGSLIYGNSTPKWDELTVGAANRVLGSDGTDVAWTQADHGAALTGLSDDDHTQYALLAGRSGGQTLTGGTASGDDITIRSTSNATKGDIILADQGGDVIIGGGATASNLRLLEASGSGTNYTEFRTQPQAANITYILPADDGDTDQVLSTNGSGTLDWVTPSSGGAVTLLKAGSGTTINTIAENLDTVAISGLTANDILIATVGLHADTQNSGNVDLYNNTDGVVIVRPASALLAGEKALCLAHVRQLQSANTDVGGASTGTNLITGAVITGGSNNAFTTAWTGSWTLALRSAGVVSGGTLRWTWTVWKVAGQ